MLNIISSKMKKNFKDFLKEVTGLAGYLLKSRYNCECSSELLHSVVYRFSNTLIGSMAFDKFSVGEDFSNEKGYIADQVAYHIAYNCE